MKHLVLLFLLAANVFAADLILTWTDNSDNEVGFIVERSPGIVTATATTFTEVARTGANVDTYTDKNLPKATDYTYRVRAYNTVGMSAPSNVASGKTGNNIPSAPTSLKIDPVNITWNTPPLFDADSPSAYALDLDRGTYDEPAKKAKKPKAPKAKDTP